MFSVREIIPVSELAHKLIRSGVLMEISGRITHLHRGIARGGDDNNVWVFCGYGIVVGFESVCDIRGFASAEVVLVSDLDVLDRPRLGVSERGAQGPKGACYGTHDEFKFVHGVLDVQTDFRLGNNVGGGEIAVEVISRPDGEDGLNFKIVAPLVALV